MREIMSYSNLNPRTQLEQQVAEDLKAALESRGALIIHHGTSASHAPASAPCDISVIYGDSDPRHAVMVEVAQRPDATEFQSIVSHLDAWVASRPEQTNLLYSGRSTSARMARLIRNENERRQTKGLRGRIIFVKLDDLHAFLERWAALPAAEVLVSGLDAVFARWSDCKDDLSAAQVIRECLFPTWEEKKDALEKEAAQRLTLEQERLKKDIVALENKLRERGVTGARAHKYLIYLFFMALFEDKRGMKTRATVDGFRGYKDTIPAADKADPEFQDRAVHHLLKKEILAHPDVIAADIGSQYEKIDLSDAFVLDRVIPVFEKYSFADASIDAIGAVFEALARRAEKDNRIGQFFTPPTAVDATCRLAGIRPTDLVLDPACGTARFLIHAMAMMVDRAHEVAGATRDATVKRIRTTQLLGCDIDPWVSIIAKMNMYIHGDGKSNIRHGNGLTLAARPTFAPQISGPLVDIVDIVPTNPPLGDIDFEAVASDVGQLLAGHGASPEQIRDEALKWSREAFEVVPHRIQQEIERDRANAKVNEFALKAATLTADGEVRKAARAKASMDEWQAKASAAIAAIASGNITPMPAGRTAKGGALFISALVRVLKPVRDASQPPEWQGGVLCLVIDEAVLNTREYASARAFIRRNFFIKAVLSLPRDAFEDLARTTAKTSILFLIRKENVAVQQREPVVFAHVMRTGPSSSDLLKPNDLNPICDAFDTWREAILSACRQDGTPVPAAHRLAAAKDAAAATLVGLQDSASFGAFLLDIKNAEERLDVAHWRMKAAVETLPKTVTLSEMADLVADGRTPAQSNFYAFASVTRLNAMVVPKGTTDTQYSVEQLQELRDGDILISGIDLVNGSVGVVGPDCAGMVVSKEYYILRARPGIDSHWLVSLLRTSVVRRIIEGTVTGTSNRTRVESADALMALRMPPAPLAQAQKEVGDILRAAHDFQRKASKGVVQAEQMALANTAGP
jgi:type I restriction-modification system DNA methylase subunit